MSKYRNRKITANGTTYDSIKEKKRHDELLLLERAGQIKHLEKQVKFVLIPAQREADVIGKRGCVYPGKLIERELSYIADFVYYENGKKVVEDVKGYKGGSAYTIFTIKRKLMLYLYGIRIREV